MKIKRLEIGCKNIVEQQKFYRDILGLEIHESSISSFELHIGYSVLFFRQKENFTPYHIAFHIPDRDEEKALKWLKNRVSVLKFESDTIIDFKGWDAKSIYFYDADANIMEFISRRNYNCESLKEFSEGSILGISEIGLATDDIQEKHHFLNANCELDIFDGNFKNFCAIGNDLGLLITINSTLKTWFPTGDKAFNSEFNLQFSNKGKQYNMQYKRNKLQLLDSLKNNF